MQIGARIAHYEVSALIGRGGMGEVWKARDLKLGRDVALKTLPAEFSADAGRVARLEREARAIAALNHPHIAAIYGIEQHDGRTFLVLELVEGGTLADRLQRGPLALAPALEVGLAIASAIETAHDQGVIHRDLKPENIAMTPDGRVKVLDFGLASAAAEQSGPSTITVVGAPMGTAPYMSPEQARGETVDAQADIWAFGVVLYEMLTDISPFKRPTGPETLARVLEAQPEYERLPPGIPPPVVRIIRRCLEKDRKRRWRDMADVRIAVEDALASLADQATATPAARTGRWRWAAVTAGVAVLAVVGTLGSRVWTSPPAAAAADVMRLAIANLPPPGGEPFGTQRIAISADGTRVAYRDVQGLTVRRLRDQGSTRFEAAGANNPFFSPDGAWIAAGNMFKVPVGGGAATPIINNTERPLGATWGDGAIVFATNSGLYRVDDKGGAARALVQPKTDRGEVLYAWPHLLPGGKSVLFTIVPRGSIDGASIAWLDLDTLETRIVLTGGTSPRYTRTGHLVYAAGRRLMAVAFDPSSATTRGQPVELRDVAIATAADTGAADFAISATGALAFLAPDVRRPVGPATFAWVDRNGKEQPLTLEPGRYVYPRVSPDGSRLAFDAISSSNNRDIWIWDFRRESLTRLTDGPTEDMVALWSPDSRRVFFSSSRGGNFDVYSQAADGSTPARLEHADPKFEWPASFTPDGKQILIGEEFSDLALLDLGRSSVEPVLRRDATDWSGALSPDGRWLAYDSNESGQFEVYVRPFPDVTGRREQVSVNGGGYPRWGPAGSGELYYVDSAGDLIAVPIAPGSELQVGRPQRLFQLDPQLRPAAGGRPYDVAPDGRFIVTRRITDDASNATSITVVLNWFQELREQVPVD